MDCEFCHKPTHIWFDCPIKPPGWRPARLAKKREPAPSSDCKSDALTKEGLAAASSNLGAPTKSTGGRGGRRSKIVGSKPYPYDCAVVLSVDTDAGSHNGRVTGFEPVSAGSTPAPASKPRGRPPTGFDKRAYNKQYMADKRAGKR